MPDRNHNPTKDTRAIGNNQMSPQEGAENQPGDHQGTADRNQGNQSQGEQSDHGDHPSRDRDRR
jgi:hypothetical protein